MSEREYVPKRAQTGQGTQRSRTQSAPAPRRDPAPRKDPAPGKKNQRNKNRAKARYSGAGALIMAAMLILTAVFTLFLARTQLLPAKFLVLLCVVLLLLLVIIALLVADSHRQGRFWTGVVISILLAFLLVFAAFAVSKGVKTLSNITGGTTEVAHVGIYVNVDDPAQDLTSTADYTFGILSQLDRNNVDRTVEQINDKLSTSIRTAEYDGLTDLVDALYGGQVGAIILNDAYLDVIEETEGYSDVYSRIREVTKLQVETQIESGETVGQATPEHVFTLFISGIDSRNGLTAKSRSDVNILATINTETKQVLLVSTPRDYFVPLSISNGVPDKLTHAGIYGINVCMDTIGMIYDINVDYYFRVNFEGFEDIIDSLGGVTVHSDYTFEAQGYQFYAGDNTLNGSQALAFARERHAFAEGDRQRGKNQMAVIRAVINKVLSPEILTKYASLMEAVEGSFETSVPYDLIASVVRDQLDNGGNWNIVSYSVDGTGASRKPYSMSTNAYVMIPDETTVQTAKDLIAQVCNDQVISEP